MTARCRRAFARQAADRRIGEEGAAGRRDNLGTASGRAAERSRAPACRVQTMRLSLSAAIAASP
ncbi:hypothetical protein AQ610_11220 [Burkholderia humptydooensis]|nr:hypothetical protein AQ610_11220 [Burkholderia humptydooensis]